MFQNKPMNSAGWLGAEFLKPSDVVSCILDAPRDFVLSVCRLKPSELHSLLDHAEPSENARRVLFAAIETPASAETIVGQIAKRIAEAAFRIWPRWYENSGVDFAICQNDSLGRQAVAVIAREAARKIAGVQPLWAEKAAQAALRGQTPRIGGFSLRAEIEQLEKAIAPEGLVLVVPYPGDAHGASADAFVHAVEWLAQSCGVVALFDDVPANEPPFDRILQHSRIVAGRLDAPEPLTEPVQTWIAPWRGSPHPLSDIEKKVATMLAADADLGALFAFNQTVTTERGTQPRVDLLWAEGRLVVELDGYESHGSRSAFARDRHRDYELMLSGYIVLRLSNDEIAQDCEKALEKIRDLVRLRRQTMTMEV